MKVPLLGWGSVYWVIPFGGRGFTGMYLDFEKISTLASDQMPCLHACHIL